MRSPFARALKVAWKRKAADIEQMGRVLLFSKEKFPNEIRRESIQRILNVLINRAWDLHQIERRI